MKFSYLNTCFIPAEKKAERLMIVLHGLGDSLDGYQWLPKEIKMNNFAYLLVNAPTEYYSGYSWFDIYENPAPGIIQSRELLIRLLKALESDHHWKPEQISFFGFSQGAVMTLETLTRYPKKLGPCVAISGYVFFANDVESFSPIAKEQRVFASGGRYDTVVPMDRTKAQLDKLRAYGMNISWHVYNRDHTIDPEIEMNDIRAFLQTP